MVAHLLRNKDDTSNSQELLLLLKSGGVKKAESRLPYSPSSVYLHTRVSNTEGGAALLLAMIDQPSTAALAHLTVGMGPVQNTRYRQYVAYVIRYMTISRLRLSSIMQRKLFQKWMLLL